MATASYKRYVRALSNCSVLAKRELSTVVAKLDASKKKATRDILLLVVPVIVEKYSALAAMAAAEYYEQEREKALGEKYTAFLADDEPLKNIEESVRFACGHLFTKENGDAR